MRLRALPAFSDNYIWMVDHLGHALVVDPADCAPVREVLQQEALQLDAILVTHHHADHIGGVSELRSLTQATVYGPGKETIPEPFEPVMQDVCLKLLGLNWQVLDVPGHTAGHVAYHCTDFNGEPLLFCGDTLFSAGCGRVFDGTMAQLHQSLQSLARLPASTLVCCTHEYTLSNLRFAQAVEPDNAALAQHMRHCQQLREQGLMTLPSRIGLELQINPFLRTHVPGVIRSAQAREPSARTDADIFATLRTWKNVF
jgi:hydroxyacylglutathione hydrolase